MPRRIFGNRKKEANQPLPTPKTPLDQKADGRKGTSVDNLISDLSPAWIHKEHRWSFTSNMSNQNSVYFDKVTIPKKPGQKKLGKRPEPLLAKTDFESVEASSSSQESKIGEFEPFTREQKSQKKTLKIKRNTLKTNKNMDSNLDVDKAENAMEIEAPLKKGSPSNGDASFRWSRLPSGNLAKKKGEWKKKMASSSNPEVDFISQSARSTPLIFTGERKGLKKTRSLETTYSRKPSRRTKSAKHVEPESSANKIGKMHARWVRQAPKKPTSIIRDANKSNRDASLDPSKLRTPSAKEDSSLSDYHSSGDVMNRSDSELSRIRTKLQKIKSSRAADESNRTRKEVRSLDRMTMKNGNSSRKLACEGSSGTDEQATVETRTRKEVRSLDRLAVKRGKSPRKMNQEDSSGRDQHPTEDTKAKLGGSLPSLSLDSSAVQRQRSKNTIPNGTSSVECNQSALSLDPFPAVQKKARKSRTRSKSFDGEDSATDLAQVLSSSTEKFHKTQESDNHAGATQLWSERMRGSATSTETPTEKLIDSSERHKPPARTRSARREQLAEGKSLPHLFLDTPVDRRRKTSKPKSRFSINVCAKEGTFGGRVRRKQKQRSHSLDHDTTWFSASDSNLSLPISRGLESFDSLEKTDSRSQEVASSRPSNRVVSTSKTRSARKLNQSSDYIHTSSTRKKVSKTRSDGSLAKARRECAIERTALDRASSARDMNLSFGSLRINSAGQILSTTALSRRSIQGKVEDDLSLSDRNDEDDRNAFEMLEDGLSKSICRLRAATARRLEAGEDSDEKKDVSEKKVTSESEAQDPNASTKNISEVIDDIADALEETKRLKSIMEVESVLHDLQNTFQQFDTVDNYLTRNKALGGENVVLRVRLRQQDELLEKYESQIVAGEPATTVHSTPAEEVRDTSAEPMDSELEQLRAKLHEKEKTFEEQASRCTQMETKVQELEREAQHGKQSLENRIWELEKEKTAFMVEISRLHKLNFDTSERIPDLMNSSGSSSTSEQTGLVGWLLGPRP